MCRQHVLLVLRLGNDLLLRRVYCFSMCVTQDISLETNLLWAPSIKLQIHWYCQHITLMFFMKKREYHIIHMYFLFRVVHKKSFFNQDLYHSFTTTTIKKKYWVYKFKKGVLNISNAEYIDLSIWRWYLIHHLIEASSHCFISHRIQLDRISNFVEKNVIDKFIP